LPTKNQVLSVIVPCFNEEANLRELARKVLETFDHGKLDAELVLVDDGSRDKTRSVIESLEQEHPERVVGRFHAHNQGIAQAWKTGARAASAPIVAIIDADLQYQPEDLLRLYRELFDHSVDIVQGFRSSIGRERDPPISSAVGSTCCSMPPSP
jgi:phenylacetate-CoA ligase